VDSPALADDGDRTRADAAAYGRLQQAVCAGAGPAAIMKMLCGSGGGARDDDDACSSGTVASSVDLFFG
jgi:hypothetical protein